MKYIADFLKRGLLAAVGGPIVLAIIYAILGKAGVVDTLTPGEVSRGILTVTLMAFIAGGVSIVYAIEQLPLGWATLIHGAALYVDYLLIYLLNDWIPGGGAGIGIFTGIYIAGYAVIWLSIIFSIKAKTRHLNRQLREQ